jgi:hypothetical protein
MKNKPPSEERRAAGAVDPEAHPHGEAPDERGVAPVPDLTELEDAEVAEAVREAFRIEVGEALDEVRVICRHGVVTLAGDVASETLPQIARRIVEDELGFEVEDRLIVTDTPERLDSGVRNTTADDTLELKVEDVEEETSQDILETEEEGLVFVPPSRPVPERR